jgi:hypothetical protein
MKQGSDGIYLISFCQLSKDASLSFLPRALHVYASFTFSCNIQLQVSPANASRAEAHLTHHSRKPLTATPDSAILVPE